MAIFITPLLLMVLTTILGEDIMKKQLSILMVMMMIVAPLAALPLAVGGAESPDETPLAGGSGTIGDPYLIETVT